MIGILNVFIERAQWQRNVLSAEKTAYQITLPYVYKIFTRDLKHLRISEFKEAMRAFRLPI